MTLNLDELKQLIPYKWKIQSFNNKDKKFATKGSCVAYIDARDVQNLLDKVVRPENWQDNYRMEGDKMVAGIGILVNNNWVWKYDTGTESDYEEEKGLFSDAFKRAAVKWGIGRFLYDLEIKWVDIKDGNPVDEHGKRIYDLTKHFDTGKSPSREEMTKVQRITQENVKEVLAKETEVKKAASDLHFDDKDHSIEAKTTAIKKLYSLIAKTLKEKNNNTPVKDYITTIFVRLGYSGVSQAPLEVINEVIEKLNKGATELEA